MRALLLLLLALPAAAGAPTKPWLSDNEYATENVNVLTSGLPAGAATEATLVAISTTAAAIKARADLLATELTLVSVATTAAAIKARADLLATELTSVAISTNLSAIKARADLLATEQTLIAISTTAAAIKARADLLATEATLATRASESTLVALSTTAAAIKARADLLATEATLATRASEATLIAISTTNAAILARANLLGTEATLATRASETTQVVVSTTLAAILARANLLATESTLAAFKAQISTGPGGVNVFPSSTTERVSIQRIQATKDKFFSYNTGVVTNGTAEAAVLLFVNPSTSGVSAYLDKIILQNLSETQTTFRVYRNFVVTSSGTSVGVFPTISGSTAVSKTQAFASPTISSFGTLIFPISVSGNSAPTQFDLQQARIFPPGTRFLVTADSSTNGSMVNVLVDHSEE